MARGFEGALMEVGCEMDEGLFNSDIMICTHPQTEFQQAEGQAEGQEHRYNRGDEYHGRKEATVGHDGYGTVITHPAKLDDQGEGADGKAQDKSGAVMLIDGLQSEDDSVKAKEIGRKQNDGTDAAETCYDTLLLSTSPPEDTIQDTRRDCAESYVTSPQDRGGMLSEAESAPSSPSKYFQPTSTDVSEAPEVNASWGALHSSDVEVEFGKRLLPHSIPSGDNAVDGLAFSDPLYDVPPTADGINSGRHPNVLCPSYGGSGEAVRSSGVAGQENEVEDKETFCAAPQHDRIACGELSLRNVLSDPIGGALMDDAMVATCGHSFGKASLQRALEMQSCVNCGASVSSSTLVPNFALRAAILAFRHEDRILRLTPMKGTKRRREQFQSCPDSQHISADQVGAARNAYADYSRPRGVQFPFAVSERVLIKGNKRTPGRFFGMEAIITNQCLNGWYLVRTVDTGESVRLQYRSLQKVGDADIPSNFDDILAERSTGSHETPINKEDPSGTLSMLDNRVESAPRASQLDDAILSSIAAEELRASFPKRESSAPSHWSTFPGHVGTSPSLNDGTFLGTAEEQVHQEMSSNIVDENSNYLGTLNEEPAPESRTGVGQLETSSIISKETGDLVNSMSAAGLKTDRGIGRSTCQPDSPSLIAGEVKPDESATRRDFVSDALNLAVDHARVSGIRSRRVPTCPKSCGTSAGFLQELGSPHKVHPSGFHPHSTKEEPMVIMIPDHLLADSKGSSAIDNNGSGLEKTFKKRLGVCTTVVRQQGRDVKLRRAHDILQIMRKDMLTLEKQIPQSYLVNSWRVHRVNWRIRVKASRTVAELGAQVQDFRCCVLLTAAGGMSNEEWDKRIGLIMESGDVELLVSLWGRLYDDVYKWLELRSNVLKRTMAQPKNLSLDDVHGMVEWNARECEGPMSSVCMTTAATLAAVDAVAKGQKDSDKCMKDLLDLAVKLLPHETPNQLPLIREALEREKRHITAKLAHLDSKFGGVGGTCEPNAPTGDLAIPLYLSGSLPQSGQHASSTEFPSVQGSPGGTQFGSVQNRVESKVVAEELGSDSALPAQNVDGESTDLSDSD